MALWRPLLSVSHLQPYVEHFTSEKEPLPLSRVPKPKSSFIPSKWEHKKIVKLVHALRMGRMKKTHEHTTPKPAFYQLWSEVGGKGRGHQMHIPAPRMKLPGHAESYNPPPEYLPTPQEVCIHVDSDGVLQNVLSILYSQLIG